MKSEKTLDKMIELPEGVTAELNGNIITIKNSKQSVDKKITTKIITIKISDNKIMLSPKIKNTKREKCMINTHYAHIINMIKGLQDPFVYRLKICSSHFPMSVKINGKDMEVTNFIGEKVPRKLKIKENVDVKMEGDIITVTSVSKELAGQVSADIEKLTRRTGFDRRIFQDGIYMIEKAGVDLK